MKRVILCLFLCLTLTACSQNNSVNLDKITGKIVKATLDDNKNIIIKESDITEKATYISYKYQKTVIGLIAVKDSKGEVKIVVNTCQSCKGTPHAYFVQVGNKIRCQNCGNLYEIDKLDNLTTGGCNPISIESMTKKNGIITIKTNQLKKLKNNFKNWEGPKK